MAGGTLHSVRDFRYWSSTNVTGFFKVRDLMRVVHWTTLDTRRSYGEERYQLIGRIAGRLFVLVYTPRHEALRIISARKANQREIQHYENRSHQD